MTFTTDYAEFHRVNTDKNSVALCASSEPSVVKRER